MIEMKNVSKKFEEITALEKVSLTVQKGEIFTIIGPNGSGKTTLLRVMAGIEMPSEGEMYFEGIGVDEYNMMEVRKNSTLVFQKTALFNTTVENNVAYGLKIRRISKNVIREKVREALETVKLQGYEDRWVRRLSGGERQRVSLARALVLETKVLLLDEPTANLDPKNVSIVEEIISWVNRERETTVVMATHNMFQAETLTKKMALIIGGKIVQVGTPKEVFGAPSKHLASFARLENVFSGFSSIEKNGTSFIDVGEGVQIEAVTQKEGKVTIFISPEDIILSENPITSSARNMFKGRIVEIADLGSIVKLKILAGKRFTVQITKKSHIHMEISFGSEVYLSFKASSVQIV